MALTGEDRLIVAVLTGSIAEVQRELQAGARLDTLSLNGQTPLGVACDRNDRDMIRFLLECGADPDEIDYEGSHALEYAMWRGHDEAIDFLLEYGDDEARRKRGELALFYAAQYGVPDLVCRLLMRGVNVNAADQGDCIPLMGVVNQSGWVTEEADLARRRQVAQLLLEAGADVTRRQRGVTAMFWACHHGDREMVHLLRSVGARIELTEAAMIGDMEATRFLLDQGANPNIPDPFGDAALFHAANNGHADVARLLLERGADAGADVNVRNAHGWTALNYAVYKGHESVADLLRAAGGVAVSEDEI